MALSVWVWVCSYILQLPYVIRSHFPALNVNRHCLQRCFSWRLKAMWARHGSECGPSDWITKCPECVHTCTQTSGRMFTPGLNRAKHTYHLPASEHRSSGSTPERASPLVSLWSSYHHELTIWTWCRSGRWLNGCCKQLPARAEKSEWNMWRKQRQ